MRFRIATLLAPALLFVLAAGLNACTYYPYYPQTASTYYYSDYDYYTSRAYLCPGNRC
jgi:hypothetical protein